MTLFIIILIGAAALVIGARAVHWRRENPKKPAPARPHKSVDAWLTEETPSRRRRETQEDRLNRERFAAARPAGMSRGAKIVLTIVVVIATTVTGFVGYVNFQKGFRDGHICAVLDRTQSVPKTWRYAQDEMGMSSEMAVAFVDGAIRDACPRNLPLLRAENILSEIAPKMERPK